MKAEKNYCNSLRCLIYVVLFAITVNLICETQLSNALKYFQITMTCQISLYNRICDVILRNEILMLDLVIYK